jgi:Heparinase II/III-like protein
VVYHRMALALLCLAELFRRQFNDPAFSDRFIARASSACDWLVSLIDQITGDAPNFGANDGTFLFNLDGAHYRDFRPAADLAAALFQGKRYFGASKMLQVFGISAPQTNRQAHELRVFAEGGLISSRRGNTLALLRIPRFTFRPGHADGLHLDVWHEGINVLRDSGSYSYADTGRNGFYSGTAAHSTVTFDNRDQMPRIGRFLFGKWLFARVQPVQADIAAGEDVFWGEYKDWQGASHRRQVSSTENHLTVCDAVSGFKHQAIVNWRLCPGPWRLEGNQLENGQMKIEFESSQPFEARLADSSESRFYLHEATLPVLQIVLNRPGSVTTKFYLKQSRSQ